METCYSRGRQWLIESQIMHADKEVDTRRLGSYFYNYFDGTETVPLRVAK